MTQYTQEEVDKYIKIISTKSLEKLLDNLKRDQFLMHEVDLEIFKKRLFLFYEGELERMKNHWNSNKTEKGMAEVSLRYSEVIDAHSPLSFFRDSFMEFRRQMLSELERNNK